MGGVFSQDAGKVKEAEDFIEKTIGEFPVVIFSKTYCGYCASAKSDIGSVTRVLDNFRGAKVFELDQMANGSIIQSRLAEMTGRYTVPNVFIGGKSVGGGEDISILRHRGDLQCLIVKALSE